MFNHLCFMIKQLQVHFNYQTIIQIKDLQGTKIRNNTVIILKKTLEEKTNICSETKPSTQKQNHLLINKTIYSETKPSTQKQNHLLSNKTICSETKLIY